MKRMDFFFNKPQRHFGVENIIRDIVASRKRIALVCAWFTDTEIAQAIACTQVDRKIAVLSKADFNRGEKRAVEIIKRDSDTSLSVIGSDDWQEGIMHNKFIVADNIVWFGSYNFTFQARKNYETLVRFSDKNVADIFWHEADELQCEWPIWESGSDQFSYVDGAFRCCECHKLKPSSELKGSVNDSYPICAKCSEATKHGTR